MTTSNETPSRKGKAPGLTAYHVREEGNAKAFWTRLGPGWRHEDGKGFTLLIGVAPLDGRIVVRPRKERQE